MAGVTGRQDIRVAFRAVAVVAAELEPSARHLVEAQAALVATHNYKALPKVTLLEAEVEREAMKQVIVE